MTGIFGKATARRIGRGIGVVWLILLILIASVTAWSQEAAPPPPEPNNFVELWASVRPDPVPKELCANSHFVVSDESDHWLFKSDLADLGGALVGVGTDSNYLMAGWSKPEILVLLDFDQVVVDVHKIYRAAFLAASNPGDFMALWSKEAAPMLEGYVAESLPDPEERKKVLKSLAMARNLIEWRLSGQLKQHKVLGIATFLDDQEQYDHIVRLFRENRVLMVRGDLTGNLAMKDAAAACRKIGVPVRALYLSNAEAYFEYVKSFRENIAELPFDDRSLILRTSLSEKDPWAAKGFYRYYVQNARDFLRWLELPSVTRAVGVRSIRTHGSIKGLYYLGPPPEPKQKSAPKSVPRIKKL